MHNVCVMIEPVLDLSEFKAVDSITLLNTVVGLLSLLIGILNIALMVNPDIIKKRPFCASMAATSW